MRRPFRRRGAELCARPNGKQHPADEFSRRVLFQEFNWIRSDGTQHCPPVSILAVGAALAAARFLPFALRHVCGRFVNRPYGVGRTWARDGGPSRAPAPTTKDGHRRGTREGQAPPLRRGRGLGTYSTGDQRSPLRRGTGCWRGFPIAPTIGRRKTERTGSARDRRAMLGATGAARVGAWTWVGERPKVAPTAKTERSAGSSHRTLRLLIKRKTQTQNVKCKT